jgi:hypothetical protein
MAEAADQVMVKPDHGEPQGLPMSYELLVGIVLVNCVVTLRLWATLRDAARRKADTPPRAVLNEKIATAFWNSEPISFAAEPPDATSTIRQLSHGVVDRNLHEFFQDFEQFVHVANHRFAEYGKYGNFRFRLKDLPDTQESHWDGPPAAYGVFKYSIIAQPWEN